VFKNLQPCFAPQPYSALFSLNQRYSALKVFEPSRLRVLRGSPWLSSGNLNARAGQDPIVANGRLPTLIVAKCRLSRNRPRQTLMVARTGPGEPNLNTRSQATIIVVHCRRSRNPSKTSTLNLNALDLRGSRRPLCRVFEIPTRRGSKKFSL